MRVSTKTAEPDDSGKAPANRWMHAKHLAAASFRQVVTPNVDTLYSQIFIDLSQDALVLRKPAVSRYVMFQIMNAWSDTVAILGTGGILRSFQRADDRQSAVCGGRAAPEGDRSDRSGPRIDLRSRDAWKRRRRKWKQMVGGLAKELAAKTAGFIVQNKSFRFLGAPIGRFRTEYEYRCLVAIGGFGANPVDAAVYMKSETDDTGIPLY